MVWRFSRLIILFYFLFPLCSYGEPPSGLGASPLLDREQIDTNTMGVNAFANDLRFGDVRSQLREVKETLGLNHIRVLLHWNDQIQPRKRDRPQFGFYDQIIRSIPRGVDALIIINGLPSWMHDEQNWIDGNPRKTFVKKWARKVIRRYKRKRKVIGFQIWNEPNDSTNINNQVLGMDTSPENYVDLLRRSRKVTRRFARRKLVVGAATTSISQNFPETLDYNRELAALGAQELMDIWAIHYYSIRLETFFLGGVGDFLDSVTRPIWVTESGEKGTTTQLEYVEQLWPFLSDQIPGIERFYYYRFTEDAPADVTFGLRNLTPGQELSDLYIHLRDRAS